LSGEVLPRRISTCEARYGDEHSGGDLVERARQVLHVFAEVRRRPAEERQRDAHVATQDVAERQVNDGALPGLRQLGVVLDHVARGGDVRAVGHERTFRMPGRAGGVDDEGRPIGGDPVAESLQGLSCPRHQVFEARDPRTVISEHRRVVDDHDVAQAGQALEERQHLVDVLLVLGDEERGAGVAQLVLDLGGGGSRVDAVGHRAGRLRAQVGDHPFLARVAHDGDALAGLQAELEPARGAARHVVGVLAPADFAVQAQALGAISDAFRRGTRAFRQQVQGALQSRTRKARTSRST
jgi:hypothetical protein